MSNDSGNVLFYTTLMGLAYKDALTGLPNRRSAESYLQQLDQTKTYFFLMLDIKDFKAVNDTHGYAYGDKTLRDVAENLRSSLRDSDFLFRLGGDEFGLIVPVKAEMDLNGIVNRLQTALLCVGHTAKVQAVQITLPATLDNVLQRLV